MVLFFDLVFSIGPPWKFFCRRPCSWAMGIGCTRQHLNGTPLPLSDREQTEDNGFTWRPKRLFRCLLVVETTGRNPVVKNTKFFLNIMQKTRLKIPYRYREIVKNLKCFIYDTNDHVYSKSKTVKLYS